MAYDNVSKPVFYIDSLLYYKALGLDKNNFYQDVELHNNEFNFLDMPDVFSMSPISYKELIFNSFVDDDGNGVADNPVNIYVPHDVSFFDSGSNFKWYTAFLNHNLADIGGSFATIYLDMPEAQIESIPTPTPIFNDATSTPKNGSSIIVYDSTPNQDELSRIVITGDVGANSLNIGAISMGVQYTMPSSPDLSLELNVQFDGVDSTRDSIGRSLSNIRYSGNPIWNNGENFTNPFEVYDTLDVRETGSIRNGKKSWDLNFSYISDKDLSPANFKASIIKNTDLEADIYDSDDLDESNNVTSFATNVYSDDSFISQVWNKTLNGALPFMFQPDNTNFDDFYICKFNQNSLKITQSAYKVYDVKIQITEVW